MSFRTDAVLYLLLWTAGCAAGFTAGVLVLRRRGALSWKSVVALGFAWEGLIVGSRLHYRLEDMPWSQAIAMPLADVLGPGRRMPLGLVTGALLAGLWCLCTRARWREIGDALAVSASVMIPIGRIGCALAGCCMGTVCVAWPHALCWRYPPNTEAFTQQARTGLITLDAASSLPAHPLPLYFALASIAMLITFVWMLRRGAPPGALLAAFCILRPLSKLALEPLRGKPEPAWLMLGVPASVLVVTSATLLVLGVRRRWRARRVFAAVATGIAVTVLAVTPVGATTRHGTAPAGDVPLDARWQQPLMRYAQDPIHNRRAIRELRRMDRTQLPPMALLAMADARLRAKNYASAERLFETVVERRAGEPWDSYAQLGLGWIDLVKERYPSARERFRTVANAPSPSRLLARLVGAFLDAQAGDTDAALQTFAEIADRTDISPPLRQVATLAVGYSAYWKGQYDDAAELLEHTVSLWPDGRLADDARYAAALARWKTGAKADARDALRELAAESNEPGDMAMSSGTVWLEQRSLLRASFDNYRRAPFRAPEEQVLDFLDRDGSHLARAFLASADGRDGPKTTKASASRREAPATTADASAAAGGSRVLETESHRTTWFAAATGLSVALLAWLRRRARRAVR